MAEARKNEPGSVVRAGHSADGHLALRGGATFPPAGLAGVLALARVTDLPSAYAAGLGDGVVAEFVGGSPQARPDLNPCWLPGLTVPVVLVHGAADPVVPLAQGETYVRIRLAARLVTLPETGHFELIDPDSAAWPHVVAGLVRRLSDRTRPRGQP
jgi:pimeloyl-ACP methyl ester carboxylesterase